MLIQHVQALIIKTELYTNAAKYTVSAHFQYFHGSFVLKKYLRTL